MTRQCCSGALAALVFLGGAQLANAATVAGAMHESFGYTVGTTFQNFTAPANSTNNGGQGWNATGQVGINAVNAGWADPAVNLAAPNALGGYGGEAAQKVVTAGSLTPSVAALGYLAGTGGKLVMGDPAVNATQQMARLTGGQAIDTGAFFFSFLVQRNNDTQRTVNLAFMGNPQVNGQNERFAIGQIGTGNGNTAGNIGLLMNNQNPAGLIQNTTAPIAMGTNVTHLIVGRVDFNPAVGNDKLSIWVDPADVTTENVAGTPYLTTEAFDIGPILAIRPFVGNTTGTFNVVQATFDEIRLGGAWPQVTSLAVPVPETSSAALAGLVGLALATIRRKK